MANLRTPSINDQIQCDLPPIETINVNEEAPAQPVVLVDPVYNQLMKYEKESLKEISKRLRKLTKKLEAINRSECKISTLSEEERSVTNIINNDERKKIADKPITQALHKELQEIYDRLKEQHKYGDTSLEKKVEEMKKQYEETVKAACKDAREQGIKEGMELGKHSTGEDDKGRVFTLVKFLRLAGFRRSVKSDNPREDEAIEQVLVLVYSGDDTALDTCWKLADGSPEIIHDSNIPFARIKELAHNLVIEEDEEQNVIYEHAMDLSAATQRGDAQTKVDAKFPGNDSNSIAKSISESGISDSIYDLELLKMAEEHLPMESKPALEEEDRKQKKHEERTSPDSGIERRNPQLGSANTHYVETPRARGGRSVYRGKSVGNRGRGKAYQGDRGDHRGRGGFRGRRGDVTRGGKDVSEKINSQQPANSSVS